MESIFVTVYILSFLGCWVGFVLMVGTLSRRPGLSASYGVLALAAIVGSFFPLINTLFAFVLLHRWNVVRI